MEHDREFLMRFDVKIAPFLAVALNIVFGLQTGYNRQDSFSVRVRLL